mgnify:CR=1 FL=1
MSDIQQIIETAFERRAEITPANADAEVRNAVSLKNKMAIGSSING